MEVRAKSSWCGNYRLAVFLQNFFTDLELGSEASSIEMMTHETYLKEILKVNESGNEIERI